MRPELHRPRCRLRNKLSHWLRARIYARRCPSPPETPPIERLPATEGGGRPIPPKGSATTGYDGTAREATSRLASGQGGHGPLNPGAEIDRRQAPRTALPAVALNSVLSLASRLLHGDPQPGHRNRFASPRRRSADPRRRTSRPPLRPRFPHSATTPNSRFRRLDRPMQDRSTVFYVLGRRTENLDMYDTPMGPFTAPLISPDMKGNFLVLWGCPPCMTCAAIPRPLIARAAKLALQLVSASQTSPGPSAPGLHLSVLPHDG